MTRIKGRPKGKHRGPTKKAQTTGRKRKTPVTLQVLNILKAKSKSHWYNEEAKTVVGKLTSLYPDALGILNVLEMRSVLAGDAVIGGGFNLILKGEEGI